MHDLESLLYTILQNSVNCMVIPACMLLLLQSCCTHACLPVEFSRPAEISVPAAACMYQILLAAYPGIIMIITGDSDINAIIAILVVKDSRTVGLNRPGERGEG